MIHFHLLQVIKIVKETDDCVVITLQIPQELKNVFTYKGGQNITVRQTINGEERRRNYSICTSPFDEAFKIAVKQVRDGLFSTYANSQLKEGDFLEVMPPTGSFYTELRAGQKKNYVAFVAGSGITPLLSIIKTTLQTESTSCFVSAIVLLSPGTVNNSKWILVFGTLFSSRKSFTQNIICSGPHKK